MPQKNFCCPIIFPAKKPPAILVKMYTAITPPLNKLLPPSNFHIIIDNKAKRTIEHINIIPKIIKKLLNLFFKASPFLTQIALSILLFKKYFTINLYKREEIYDTFSTKLCYTVAYWKQYIFLKIAVSIRQK